MSLLDPLSNPCALTPHGVCPTWNPGLMWLETGLDALILLSYLCIPLCLVWLNGRRRDPACRWFVHLLVLLIPVWATTHVLAILTLWAPVYATEGLAKAATGIASFVTALILWATAPRLVVMLSSTHLMATKTELSCAIARQAAILQELLGVERKLRHANARLELSVARRETELRTASAHLLELFAERRASQQLLGATETVSNMNFDVASIAKTQIEPLSGRLLRVNGAFISLVGFQVEDLIDRPFWDLLYAEDRVAAVAGFGKLLVGEVGIWISESRCVRRDSVPVWVRISATVVIDATIGLPRLALLDIENIDWRQYAQPAFVAAGA